MPGTVTIGVVSRHSGVSIDTIRFYERRGLLPRPARRPSGFREYDGATVERIRLIKSLQALGLRLDEVAAALRPVKGTTRICDHGRPFVEIALKRIDEQIRELRTKRRALAATLRACRKGRCPVARSAGRLA